jgi:hypothetical protein
LHKFTELNSHHYKLRQRLPALSIHGCHWCAKKTAAARTPAMHITTTINATTHIPSGEDGKNGHHATVNCQG